MFTDKKYKNRRRMMRLNICLLCAKERFYQEAIEYIASHRATRKLLKAHTRIEARRIFAEVSRMREKANGWNTF